MASSDIQNAAVNSQSVGDPSSIGVHAQRPSPDSAANGNNIDQSASSSTDHLAPPPDSTTHDGKIRGELNGQSYPADHLSVGDTVSAQGSITDADSQRDALSVADAHEQSVGSDTDTGRADGGGVNGDPRSTASKKPASFKPVSVTRHFLAKTASSTPIAKLGDKSAPMSSSPLSFARPRLVAKSGSGLRDAPLVRSGGEGTSDGNSVWNKNRPVPPPPPKHFTDEELKQQYGIHLASRIQADETSKAPKWADLDDEEDDWAPEPIQWMDGTKSTIKTEPVPASTPPPVAEPPRPVETRPILTPLKRTLVIPSGPPKTILRPGQAQQARLDAPKAGDSSDSKGGLQIKATAPVPVKSPWATLPPLDKSAPIVDFSTPSPPPPKPSFGTQDARMLDSSASAIRHEMEADTFDRGWRESDRGPRELFNSHSGRYEPAPEGRRMSFKQDSGLRQPAVLQRSSRGESSEAIVDAPAAFTARNQQMDGSTWSRRRGSSVNAQNVQPTERRMSNKYNDVPNPQESRTGIVIGHDIGPQAKQDAAEAQRVQQEAIARNEEIALQKRIMHEKVELARRRRREDEEKEEAERRERIRLKLQAMGPVTGADASTKEAAQGDQSIVSPPSKFNLDVGGDKGHVRSEGQEQRTDVDHHYESEQGQPKQLGGTHSDTTVPTLSQLPPPPPGMGHAFNAKSPGAMGASLTSQHSPGNAAKVSTSSYSSPGDHKAQPTFKSPSLGGDGFVVWDPRTSPGHAAQASNVWGPPGALRHIGNGALGNGAFDSTFSRIPPRLQHHQPSSTTAHFATGVPVRSPSAGTRQETSPMRHQQMLSDQNMVALGLVDTPSEIYPSSISTGPSPMPSQQQERHMPPIAPPQRVMPQTGGRQTSAARSTSAWSQFVADAQAEAARSGLPAQMHMPQHQGMQQQPVQQRWKETFKQTKVTGNWAGGEREVARADDTIHDAVPHGSQQIPDGPKPPTAHTQVPSIHPTDSQDSVGSTVRLPSSSSLPAGSSGARTPGRAHPGYSPASAIGSQQSRFFPSSEIAHAGSPPPEGSHHPVHGGNKQHPVVNLPRAKPNVRLPPSALAAAGTDLEAGSVIMPERSALARAGIQPIAQSHDWQARFNGLFGRVHTTAAAPPSPPKTPPKLPVVPSQAPDTLSRGDLLDVATASLATVSLPSGTKLQHRPKGQTPIVKPVADELFESELSFGSTPKVSVPRNPVYAPGPDRQGTHLLRMRPLARLDRPVNPVTRPALALDGPVTAMIIYVPASRGPPKTITLPKIRKPSWKPAPQGQSALSTPPPAAGKEDKLAEAAEAQTPLAGRPPRAPRGFKARQAAPAKVPQSSA